jgi:hypothetical protein
MCGDSARQSGPERPVRALFLAAAFMSLALAWLTPTTASAQSGTTVPDSALGAAVTASPTASAPPRVLEAGPQWVTPTDGELVPYLNDLTFQVQPVEGSVVGYLYGFFENGVPVWENYANEGHLDGTTYVLPVGSAGHRALGSGANGHVTWPLQVWARAYIDDGNGIYHWCDLSVSCRCW